MRILVWFALVGCCGAAAAGRVRAQASETDRPEEAAVRKIVAVWQHSTNETLRRQAATTLQQMALEMAPTLARLVAEEREAARTDTAMRAEHRATVTLLAGALGRLGNLLVHNEEVRASLLAVAKDTSSLPADVRMAAIEALGRIYAGRSVFLTLTREEFWLKFEVNQRTPVEMSKFLQNEAATLKEKFSLAKPPDAARARELILTTRNVGRKIRLYRNVISLLNELEPLRDKTLPERINEALAATESSLLIVAAGGKDAAEAALRAEKGANDLYEEMEHTAANILRWQKLNLSTSAVIAALRGSLDDPAELVRFSAVEALGRIYGKID